MIGQYLDISLYKQITADGQTGALVPITGVSGGITISVEVPKEPLGNESNVVGCHIRSLRKKLWAVDNGEYIRIGCIREIGYCLEQIK